MPGGDRTGPLGEGPMTGRQLGYGAGYQSPGYTRGGGWGGGRGFFGRGRRFLGRLAGQSRGFGAGYMESDVNYPENQPQSTDSIEGLKSDVQALKGSMKTILERLDTLTGRQEEK